MFFTLTIDRRPDHCGEDANAERQGIVHLLRTVAQDIGSGAAPSPLLDGSGRIVGSYEFGASAINGRRK